MPRARRPNKNDIDELFAEAAIAARERLGLNKRELAAISNVDAAQLTRLERRDRSGVRLATAVALAAALGLSLDEIAELDGTPQVGDLEALRRRLRPKTTPKRTAPRRRK